MNFFEEKSPSGIILKVVPEEWEFLAFNSEGKTIYANENTAQLMHKVLLIIFMGNNFTIRNNFNLELSFFKIVNNEIVIPFLYNNNTRRYLFIKTNETLDLLPVRLLSSDDILSYIRYNKAKSTLLPDYIVVNGTITRDEVISIKQNLSDINIILIDEESNVTNSESDSNSNQGEDNSNKISVKKNKNINMISNNPVFLAKIHLREMNLSMINQLILDFDISVHEANYILSFIDSMLKRKDDAEINNNLNKLTTLKNTIKFYIHMLQKEENEITTMIKTVIDNNELSSYSTIIAKVKGLYPDTDNQLVFTEYENLIYEKKSEIQKED